MPLLTAPEEISYFLPGVLAPGQFLRGSQIPYCTVCGIHAKPPTVVHPVTETFFVHPHSAALRCIRGRNDAGRLTGRTLSRTEHQCASVIHQGCFLCSRCMYTSSRP